MKLYNQSKFHTGGLYMISFNIMLRSINDVKDFVNTVNKYDFDVDLTSGRYVVDAKSIMGIFSLDLSKPIKVEIQDDNSTNFREEIKRFIV
jgi:phosphocarrier protein HPr